MEAGTQAEQQLGRALGGEGGSKKACEVAAALVCTLSQNGYGDGGSGSPALPSQGREAVEGRGPAQPAKI